ncbi:YeiH family protein [Natranaerofaba carboxydovora]|uniref:YeiH family protein n=1 Tax=Natranaerofaba carboxydovora TaxID=2742683 RepID=UPI001F13F7DE|nr:putative sulfate exporter family transporter [Natranaerofaba carboxydovora]UMZ72698.1 hypothetical protein ACONDI_00224 [Natranaerofaba carboxydovora]
MRTKENSLDLGKQAETESNKNTNTEEIRKVNPLLATEDWWAVWLGFFIIALTAVGLFNRVPEPGGWMYNPLNSLGAGTFLELIIFGAALALVLGISVYFVKGEIKKYLYAFGGVFALAVAAYVLGQQEIASEYGLGDVVWALILGITISNTVGVPETIRPAIKSELYIKIGLVLLGAEILFHRLLVLGMYGIGVAWIVTPIVLVSMYFIGTRVLGIKSKSLVVTIGAATSVCGVSAAIVSGGASKASKEEMTLAVSITSLFTIFMIVLMPVIVSLTGMDALVGGAWIGGTVDATGAVVVASSVLGSEAMEVAATIKMIQNVLIGIIGFAIAFIWVSKIEKKAKEKEEGVTGEDKVASRVSVSEIWNRFPKFILGFVAASVLFSFVFFPQMGEAWVEDVLGVTSGLRGWFFALAFISIGLNSNLIKLKHLLSGGKPVILYVMGQGLNLALTLAAAYVLFSGNFIPAPF